MVLLYGWAKEKKTAGNTLLRRRQPKNIISLQNYRQIKSVKTKKEDALNTLINNTKHKATKK